MLKNVLPEFFIIFPPFNPAFWRGFLLSILIKLDLIMLTLYGIAHCDTVKRARLWLERHNIDVVFYDFAKKGLSDDLAALFLQSLTLETLINKRSTTWRKLTEQEQKNLASNSVDILKQYPTLIKRPVWQLINSDHLYEWRIGFNKNQEDDIYFWLVEQQQGSHQSPEGISK